MPKLFREPRQIESCNLFQWNYSVSSQVPVLDPLDHDQRALLEGLMNQAFIRQTLNQVMHIMHIPGTFSTNIDNPCSAMNRSRVVSTAFQSLHAGPR
jgi:hypothetical protein